MLHIDDLVDLYLAAAGQTTIFSGEVFNIGGGISNSLSVLELLDSLENLLGENLNKIHIEPRASDQKFFVADTIKAQNLLKWKPSITISKGLVLALEWERNKLNVHQAV
ncbi:hypothetical protein MEN41_22505 [Dolichospermum sp. ST_con]|nr:hypothetical protein [Dolichospermum sp. ST_con]